MQAPGAAIALGRTIVGEADLLHQLRYSSAFAAGTRPCQRRAIIRDKSSCLTSPQPASALAMKRARVVTLNAALGPLDYRVPDGMTVEPGSIVVAPLGPRQLLGVAWEAERLPTNEVPDARLRPLAGVLDVPPIAAPLRRLCEWTADYYLAPLASVLRMVLPSSAALEGPRQLTEYRPTGVVPDRLTPQREKALAALEGRQGTIRELADHAGVSDAVMRGLVNAGALEAVAVDADRPLACPDPDHAPPELNDDQREAAASLAAADRQGLRPGPARRRHRLGQDRSLFRGDRRMPAPGQAGARPAARDRADRAVPQALRGALRLRAGRVAFGPALVAAAPRLARNRQRRSGGHRRRALGPVPALPEARPDRRRRGARAELQAGGRGPVSRPRHRGDARPSSRTFRSSSRPQHRRSRAGTWSSSAAIARSACPSASPARTLPDITRDRPDAGSAAARPLAGARRWSRNSKPTSSAASSRCCSSTAAASRR